MVKLAVTLEKLEEEDGMEETTRKIPIFKYSPNLIIDFQEFWRKDFSLKKSLSIICIISSLIYTIILPKNTRTSISSLNLFFSSQRFFKFKKGIEQKYKHSFLKTFYQKSIIKGKKEMRTFLYKDYLNSTNIVPTTSLPT